ncbi:hypothetical protein [Catenuloplanes indicus]|uniref:Restriction system protein n=1 Tax=Catenuloplanes indicus TaxID=137267 RepID=A0AAE3W1H1_9ACTN|nr:hypothetical protein [Catenuloplanes indicus]MDQ0367557.1 restriction system protein [Catenuloplanes indicus]
MTNLWVLRSLRAEDYESMALSSGYAAMGWANSGDLTHVVDVAGIRAAVRRAFPFSDKETTDSCTDQLHQFRIRVVAGDYLLLLRRNNPNVAFGKVTGDYHYRTDLSDGIRHIREVDWIHSEIPRVAVEQDLRSMPSLNMIYLLEDEVVAQRIIDASSAATPSLENTASSGSSIATSGAPFQNFKRNLEYARNLAAGGAHLHDLGVGSFEVNDVFRAAWVQGVAALEYWVRQEVRTRMMRLAANPHLSRPQKFNSFPIPIEAVERILQGEATLADVVDDQLITTRGHIAYQNPDKIKDALSLIINTERLWESVAKTLQERSGDEGTLSGKEIQDKLTSVVFRRNKIAHEYDEDPRIATHKRSIDGSDVTQALDLIEQLAAAVLVAIEARSDPHRRQD